jgi:hypothetical protein
MFYKRPSLSPFKKSFIVGRSIERIQLHLPRMVATTVLTILMIERIRARRTAFGTNGAASAQNRVGDSMDDGG